MLSTTCILHRLPSENPVTENAVLHARFPDANTFWLSCTTIDCRSSENRDDTSVVVLLQPGLVVAAVVVVVVLVVVVLVVVEEDTVEYDVAVENVVEVIGLIELQG